MTRSSLSAFRPIPAVLAGALLIAAAPAVASTLTVTVHDVRSDKGHVRVGVCTRATFLSEHCEYHDFKPSQKGDVTAVIHDIPPGVYAVASFQDENDDTHLNKNFFGKPTEGLGFSRDPVLHLSPPKFDQCAVRIGPADGVMSLTLHYY